jgi:alcohol dehydrogenase
MNFQIDIPTHIIFGSGSIKELGRNAAKYGRKAFLLTMEDMVKNGLLEEALKSLRKAKIDVHVSVNCKPEPTSQSLDSLRDEVVSSKSDFIIGIGGGSVLDSAKAIAILATNSGEIWEYVDLRNRPARALENKNLPVIAVPTTSGTGSEVTMNSVLINENTKQKATIKFKSIIPILSINDPDLTLSMPENITGMTGFDGFTHALESCFNNQKRTKFSDFLALEAMKTYFDYLPGTVDDPNWLLGRQKCSWASLLAGLTISHAGTTVAHAIGQPATARLGIPHGLAVSIFTIPVLEHTFKYDEDRFSLLAETLNYNQSKGLSMREKAKLAVTQIMELQRKVGVNKKLKEYSVDRKIIDDLTDDTVGYMGRGLPQHVVEFDKKEIRSIISRAF